jgi:hypothetical protein
MPEKNKDARRVEMRPIEPTVARRVLQIVNAARQAEELTHRPGKGIVVMVERYNFKGPDFHEAMEEMEREAPEPEPLLDAAVARRLIEWREENSPLYGFTNIKQLLELIPERFWPGILTLCGRGEHGQWGAPLDIPAQYDRPVHGALMRTAGDVGKVLFFGLPHGNNTFLWDPNVVGPAAFSAAANQPTDSLFCSGHTFLSDGRLLVAGGGGDGTVTPRHNRAWTFDPVTVQWARTAGNGAPNDGDMHFIRWYPTLVTMGDEPGRALVACGTGGPLVTQMELYSETADHFELVWGPSGVGDTTADRSFPQLYPGLHLLPGAEIFYTPTGWAGAGSSPTDYPGARLSAYFSFTSTSSPATGAWTNVGPIAVPPATPGPAENAIDRVKGMAVLLLQPSYPFVQVMAVGGGGSESTGTYQMINLSELTPEWGDPLPLPDGAARVNVNLVLLPDGKVFMCGGRPPVGTPTNGGACWTYDPATSTWYEMDPVSHTRQYHSVALLLPSGQVMVAGNEATNDRTIEVFSPPYLFNANGTLATRPQITSLPALVHHGSAFAIQTPDPTTIGRVVLVRPMAVTHQTDSQQRVIPLTFTRTGPTTLTATMPDGWHPHAIAPRGWYLLFILNAGGVPSEGKFIYLH